MKKLVTHSRATRAALARREPFNTYGAFRTVDGGPDDPAAVPAVGERIRSRVRRQRSGTADESADVAARIDDVLSRSVPANSGEGAIYSAEYLERKYGPRDRAEAA